MKAMVFAAGVGSRLKELTKDHPKCLMVAGGKTLLEHVILRLKAAGVTEIMINVHHLHQQVIDYVLAHSHFDISISFSYERELLDTGGGLKNVRDFFRGESCFLIHNSDIYSNLNLSALVDYHKSRSSIATLAVMKRSSARGLYFDSAQQLVGWTSEKDQLPPTDSELLAFSGISAASAELFDFMPNTDAFSLITPFLSAARASNRVTGYRIDQSEWTDIGTPESLLALQKRIQ
jgi:N-acetyl-alpha-D-muramate 1-phosphate uridylyltransferase